ncbi:hypothetical protein [Asticcacaulis sp. 201]|uniref:hypothetical protein n=1 Tax=Asticcacaulis sp. 201 TaxID=3028787 RepID=UPI002916280E|nr:hypothetical protein [Asticcacaulis sp. 201]MDV6330229.1 hypothetical protein [Asticcacaulis sp. 201]
METITLPKFTSPFSSALAALTMFMASFLGGQACAAPNAVADPNSAYHDGKFDIYMVGCVEEPVAVCTLRVSAKRKTFWDNSSENRLIDIDGVSIPATSIAVGGDEVSLPAHAGQYWAQLEEGISTKIEIKFDGPVKRSDIQFLILYVGHWSAKTIKLKPIWK